VKGDREKRRGDGSYVCNGAQSLRKGVWDVEGGLKGAEQGEVGLGGQGKVESSDAVVVSEQDAKDIAHDIVR
jgi:hypothetical protein